MSTHACIRLTRIKSIAISVCLAMLIASQPMAQSLEYDILWFGTIGKLTINKSTVAGQEHISTESKVKIPFYTFNWITSATIKDGLLQRSTYEQVLNDDQREYCKITRKADKDWLVEYGSGEKKNISISHTFYVSELYFKEPKNVTMVFSERFAKPLELRKLSEGHYKLLLPEDNYCEYFYEAGVCKLAKAKNGNRTIKMVLAETL